MKRFLRITAIIAAVACLVSAAAPAFAAELYENAADRLFRAIKIGMKLNK